MKKVASLASRKEQSEAKFESYVRSHLLDAGGALPIVLIRHVNNSELFLTNAEQPFVVLANCIQQVLGSEYLLAELVREADAEWGRLNGHQHITHLLKEKHSSTESCRTPPENILNTQLIDNISSQHSNAVVGETHGRR